MVSFQEFLREETMADFGDAIEIRSQFEGKKGGRPPTSNSLQENTTPTPHYRMTFQDRSGDLTWFQDTNGVRGTIDIGEGCCTIYEFGSTHKGKGFSEMALLHLQKEFGIVVVRDIGNPGDPSYLFWRHMLRKGIVSEVHDDEGTRHTSWETMSEMREALGL